MNMPEAMPIYIVVLQGDVIGVSGLLVWRLIKSIPCDLRDYQEVWKREVDPLYSAGARIQGWLVYREPDTPVRDMTKMEGTAQ